MKLINPEVELRGLMFFIDNKCDETAPEKLIEEAGRACYGSKGQITGDSHIPFIQKVCGQLHHDSISEHSGASFRVVCDIGVAREVFRHRIASIDDTLGDLSTVDPHHPSPYSLSQESTRYCNYSKDKFGCEISLSPMHDGLTDAQIARRMALYEMIEEVYLAEQNEGVKPQQSRDILPICLKTEFYMTTNFREWKHFLNLRLSPAAHPQMQEIAKLIRDILLKVAPIVFAEFAPVVTGSPNSCTTSKPSP